jgi:hypothetical protein
MPRPSLPFAAALTAMASRRVRIWDCAQQFTKDNLVSVVTNAVIALSLGQEEAKTVSHSVSHSDGDNLFCTSCQVSISDHSHYKTEWHRVNTKLRSVGAKPVTQTEFERLDLENDLGDEEEYLEERLAEASASSSSFAADQQAHTGSARITFVTKANETMAVWKSVLLPGKSGSIAQFASSALKLSDSIDPSFQSAPKASSSSEKGQSSSESTITPSALQALPQHPFQWIILLCQGGFFAGAVFRGDQVLKHKRIAKYTVRRKQGGSQASKDQTKGGIHSAGASIRRQNEVRLREEIAELLHNWGVEIAQSTRIFLHAPSFNSSSFYYEGSPISRRDPRVRNIPIVTQRPSFVELQRIHLILSTVEISAFDGIENLKKSMEMAAQSADGSNTPNSAHFGAKSLTDSQSIRSSSSSIYSLTEGEHANWTSENVSSTGEVRREVETTRVDLLATAIDGNNIEEVRRLLLEEEYIFPIPDKADEFVYPLMRAFQLSNEAMVRCLIDCGELLDERSPKYALKTILHVACEKAQDEWVERLLSEFGANPTVLDLYNHTPYDLAKEKSTRTLMRKFAGANPDLWDYSAARIPPLTGSMEMDAKAREAEKRKRKKAAQKERKAAQKEEDAVQRAAEAERVRANAEELLAKEAALERTKRILNMSEREKRALAAERRLNPSAITCDNCGKAIATEPYEKFSFKYCSSNCVVEHKRILDTLQSSASSSSK